MFGRRVRVMPHVRMTRAVGVRAASCGPVIGSPSDDVARDQNSPRSQWRNRTANSCGVCPQGPTLLADCIDRRLARHREFCACSGLESMPWLIHSGAQAIIPRIVSAFIDLEGNSHAICSQR